MKRLIKFLYNFAFGEKIIFEKMVEIYRSKYTNGTYNLNLEKREYIYKKEGVFKKDIIKYFYTLNIFEISTGNKIGNKLTSTKKSMLFSEAKKLYGIDITEYVQS